MWQETHEMTFKGLSKDAVWSLWADVDHWHEWDKGLDYAKLNGRFEVGSGFTLKPKGGPKVKLSFLRVDAMKGFTDLTKFPLAKMYGIHDMEETPAGLKLTVTMRVEGPLTWLWTKLVARGVAADAPAQMQAMVDFAARKKAVA